LFFFCAAPKAEALLAKLGDTTVGLVAIHESAIALWALTVRAIAKDDSFRKAVVFTISSAAAYQKRTIGSLSRFDTT